MAKQNELLHREKLLRDTFTAAETQVFGLTIATSIVAFWFGEPRSMWLLGFFLIAGGMTPYILRTHEISHPFFINALWKRAFLLCAPAWVLMTQFTLGLFQNPVGISELGDSQFYTLRETSAFFPVSTQPAKVWPTVFGLSAIYILLVNLFIVPKSRFFFELMMPWLCSAAVAVAIFGYIQAGLQLDGPFLTKGTGHEDFFAFFPYDGHWAAFAMLWMTACFAMAMLITRQKNPDTPLADSTAPFYLTGGIILGATALLVDARLPSAALLIGTSLMLLLFAAQFATERKDPHRRSITFISGLISTAGLTLAIIKIFQISRDEAIRERLQTAAMTLFKEKPFFGWGLDSFGQLLPFYGSDLLQGEPYERTGSDLLQYLAELGIFGMVLPSLIGIALVIRYIVGRHDIQLTNHLLIGCVSILILGAVDTPFMSPTVVFSFFTLFFIALRWADLSRNKADEVDTKSVLVVRPLNHDHSTKKHRPSKHK